MSKFSVGQVWEYRTRADEGGSRVRVLRVDETGYAGVIVHVSVDGLSIRDPSGPDRPMQTIGFMPIAEAELDASVTRLVADGAGFVPSADFEEGYAGWREGFDAGKAGFWTVPVAEVVQAVADGMRRTK